MSSPYCRPVPVPLMLFHVVHLPLPTSEQCSVCSGIFCGAVKVICTRLSMLTLARCMQGTAKLDVWSEVVAPFHLMPRGVLEGSGSAVMAGLVRSLLPPFLQRYAQPLASIRVGDKRTPCCTHNYMTCTAAGWALTTSAGPQILSTG